MQLITINSFPALVTTENNERETKIKNLNDIYFSSTIAKNGCEEKNVK